MPALIYPGEQGYMESSSWNSTTTQSGSFICTAASSTPIQVFTKEVRYIHKLSLTLKYSMPISSPAAPGGIHKNATICECVLHSKSSNLFILDLTNEYGITL